MAFASRHILEPATVIRQAAGDFVPGGRFVPGSTTSEDIELVAAPVGASSSGTWRNVMPEGARVSDWREFWLPPTVKPLRVGARKTGPDVIIYEDTRYCMFASRPWTKHGFIAALGVREEGQDSDLP